MQKHIVYVIRYSVLQHTKAWKLARQHDFDTYRQKLFAPDRLALKYALFTRFTFPSLLMQQANAGACKCTVLLLVSPEMPLAELERLYALTVECPQLQLLNVAPDERVPAKVDAFVHQLAAKGEYLVSTVRLDDDDVLAPEFENKLSEYLTESYVGKVVTFARGYELLIDSQSLRAIKAQRLTLPKIALGLSYIAHFNAGKLSSAYSNVYQLGSHDEVQRAADVVKDTSFHAYIRVAYDEQDTQAEGFRKRENQGANSESISTLVQKFPGVQIQ